MKNTAIPEANAARSANPGLEKVSAQRGGVMIESLIGLLLLSLVGGGVMHATARMANTQQLQAMHNISVNQMREMATTRKGTAGANICIGDDHVINVPGAAEPAPLTVKGCAPVNFKISNVKIGGAVLNNQTVASARPVVIEVGADAQKVRVGGAEVVDAPAL
ncbi:hypothetical protein D0C16_21660 [Cellvibrio sp. KY-GH-1]|uniref:hypothetical protein n=1 Tax=Cellvibrio sp. KY-GH-1 TaxID=2303332 RepID=UPI001247900F|nr:hypothetical protein [Cellvibrio sp. KY-GH-1]QEY18364.1 hypothetical protein D0C16_21660 [Cellvibrio sp. KY-GH-1]